MLPGGRAPVLPGGRAPVLPRGRAPVPGRQPLSLPANVPQREACQPFPRLQPPLPPGHRLCSRQLARPVLTHRPSPTKAGALWAQRLLEASLSPAARVSSAHAWCWQGRDLLQGGLRGRMYSAVTGARRREIGGSTWVRGGPGRRRGVGRPPRLPGQPRSPALSAPAASQLRGAGCSDCTSPGMEPGRDG